MPVRTTTNELRTESIEVHAIQWAAEHGAGVICVAAGGRRGAEFVPDEIKAAIRADAVIVAAAGNVPPATGVEYPAAYPGVVAVAGVDRNGKHAAISAIGPEVMLAAPAVDIMSTYLDHGYGTGTGTSAATAIVAGAAALVRARFPTLSAAEVIHRLTATATDVGKPGRDDEYGYGIVNLTAALTANVPPLSGTAAAPTTPPSSGAHGGASSTPPVAGAGATRWTPGWVVGVAGTIAGSIALTIVVGRRRRRAPIR